MYKKFNKEYLLPHIKGTKPVIFDVGCYDGKDAMEFINMFDKSSVYAFDPSPCLTSEFKSCLMKNQRLHLIKTAVGDVDGTVEWYESSNHSASSSFKKPKDHLTIFGNVMFNKASDTVSCRLDTWVKDNFHSNSIDLLWVDVNGAEKEFLDGATETLGITKLIFIEFSGVKNQKLYCGSLTKEDILSLLPEFSLIDEYDFMGNYGNLLLKKKNKKEAT